MKISVHEKPICRKLKAQLAINSPILLPDGSHFIFLNRMCYYDTILCLEGRVTTVEELTVISEYLFINGVPLCSMLVWAIMDAVPILVKVRPGRSKPVKIIWNSSQYSLGYVIINVPKKEA